MRQLSAFNLVISNIPGPPVPLHGAGLFEEAAKERYEAAGI